MLILAAPGSSKDLLRVLTRYMGSSNRTIPARAPCAGTTASVMAAYRFRHIRADGSITGFCLVCLVMAFDGCVGRKYMALDFFPLSFALCTNAISFRQRPVGAFIKSLELFVRARIDLRIRMDGTQGPGGGWRPARTWTESQRHAAGS